MSLFCLVFSHFPSEENFLSFLWFIVTLPSLYSLDAVYFLLSFFQIKPTCKKSISSSFRNVVVKWTLDFLQHKYLKTPVYIWNWLTALCEAAGHPVSQAVNRPPRIQDVKGSKTVPMSWEVLVLQGLFQWNTKSLILTQSCHKKCFTAKRKKKKGDNTLVS